MIDFFYYQNVSNSTWNTYIFMLYIYMYIDTDLF